MNRKLWYYVEEPIKGQCSFGNVTLKNILFEEALMLRFLYSTKLFTKRPFFHALKIFRILAIRKTKM